ncbi:MAG TPA: gephyrin-like molybdotransferase Glp [Thermoanaerobaculia bacterium]
MTAFPPLPHAAPLPVEEAQRRVLEVIPLLDAEEVSLLDALGRVLREDVVAPHDIPEGDNSAMDGYAVRAADVTRAPVSLRVIGDIPAGRVAERALEPGTAMRIMTGALLPEGADAVAQVEITDGGDEVVVVNEPLTPGANLRRRGEDMRRGDVVLRAGVALNAGEIGVLASAQKSNVRVSRRPVVAILSTGDELVDVGEPRAPGKVVNSNAYALAALVRESGAVPRMLGIVRDDREATIRAIESALESDFVLSSGGVSVGAYDFVKTALAALGAETKFWRVAMKPGKPLILATLRGRVFFGLPGNPVSSMVSFLLFVAPALRKAMGLAGVLPPIVDVPLDGRLRSNGARRTYFRVRVVARDGALVAVPMTAQGSGVSTSMLQANGLAIVDEGVTLVEPGSALPVVLLSRPH